MQSQKRSRIKVLLPGIIMAIIHLLITSGVYLINIREGVSYEPILWMALAFLDFPVSLGLGFRGFQIAGDYYWNNATMPLLYFGIVGTLWWFLMGCFFGMAARKLIHKFILRTCVVRL